MELQLIILLLQPLSKQVQLEERVNTSDQKFNVLQGAKNAADERIARLEKENIKLTNGEKNANMRNKLLKGEVKVSNDHASD